VFAFENPNLGFKNFQGSHAYSRRDRMAQTEMTRDRDDLVQMKDFSRKLLVQIGNFLAPVLLKSRVFWMYFRS